MRVNNHLIIQMDRDNGTLDSNILMISVKNIVTAKFFERLIYTIAFFSITVI